MYLPTSERPSNLRAAACFHLATNPSNLASLPMIRQQGFVMAYALRWLVVAAALLVMRRST